MYEPYRAAVTPNVDEGDIDQRVAFVDNRSTLAGELLLVPLPRDRRGVGVRALPVGTSRRRRRCLCTASSQSSRSALFLLVRSEHS